MKKQTIDMYPVSTSRKIRLDCSSAEIRNIGVATIWINGVSELKPRESWAVQASEGCELIGEVEVKFDTVGTKLATVNRILDVKTEKT